MPVLLMTVVYSLSFYYRVKYYKKRKQKFIHNFMCCTRYFGLNVDWYAIIFVTTDEFIMLVDKKNWFYIC